MILKNKVTLFIVFLFISILSFSQKANDSIQFNLLINKLENAVTINNEDSVAIYFQKLSHYSNQEKYYKKFIDATTRVGHFYEGYGSFEKSINIYQKALSITELFNDSSYASKVLVDMSQAYRIFHDYPKAIEYGKRAIHILKKENSKNNLILKTAALDITAAAFTENKQADSAVVYQEKVLSYLPELDSTDIKTTIVNIGYTYMELNQLEKVRIYTEHGLRLFKPLKNDYYLAAIYTNLAMYGRRAKKYKYALKMFDTAIYHTKKSNYLEPFFWIYDERSKVYKSQKQYKKAAEDLEKLVKIKDSVFKTQRAKTAQEMEAKYQSAKKGKEIAQQKEQILANELAIKNRNLFAILLGSALLIVAILSLGFYKRNQFRRKQLQKEIDLKDALSTIKTQNKLQEQRLRISRDLHDNIGSQLTFIISSVDNLKYVTKDANDKLKDKLASISSFTSDTIFQLRDTIWAMNKPEISLEDLHTRILSFIEKAKSATENTKFILKNDVNQDIKFTSLIGVNIFRVVQEAINNAIKYADASEVKIDISEENNQISIVIKDNGKGIPQEIMEDIFIPFFSTKKSGSGIGLSLCKQIMLLHKGKIQIKSIESKGTTVSLIF